SSGYRFDPAEGLYAALGRLAAIGDFAPIFQPAQAFSALSRAKRRAGSCGESVVKYGNSALGRASLRPRAPGGTPLFVHFAFPLAGARANEAARPGQLAATCRRCGLLFGSVRRLSGSASSLTWRTPGYAKKTV